MKIRLLTGISGDGIAHSPGEVIDVPNAEGKSRCELGQAEPVAEKPAKRASTRKQSE